MKIKNNFLFCIFISFLMFALFSCKMKAEQKSLTSYFEIVDSFIADGDFKAAIKELKNIEKKAYDSWSYIGIYKRYIGIGENEKAEKLLIKALKKNSSNQELNAVYSHFLLDNNRIFEALKHAEILRGGDYGSIYSEAILKNEQIEQPSKQFPEYYKDSKFYEIYFDAYKAAKNPVWIRNCAIYHLLLGDFEKASEISPLIYKNLSDSYFWALVHYDAQNFYDSINAIEVAKAFLAEAKENVEENSKSIFQENIQNYNEELNPSFVELTALESDSYLNVLETEKAQQVRSVLFSKIDDLENSSIKDEKLLQLLSVNSVIYAVSVDDDITSTNILNYIVQKWPDFEKGLVLYADYAFNSNLPRDEDIEVQTLRKLGLKTIEMEKYDNKKRLSVSTAISQIDKALENKLNPVLALEKLDLKYKLDDSYTVKQKTADLWYLIEQSINQDLEYDPVITDYALSFLLKTNQYDEAYSLFHKYISNTLEFDLQEDFWIQLERNLARLDLIQAEFAAYFAACQGLYDETIRFYEYCVYESAGITTEKKVSPYVSIQTCMNLADIYYSLGKNQDSVDLYGVVIGRENNSFLKSEAFYRLACVYVVLGDIKNALRSVEYSSSIYPGNARAALLKEKLLKK